MSNQNGIFGTIAAGFAESTRNVRAINKEYSAVVKAETKELTDKAKTPDPGVVRFKEAKGFGNKMKVVGQNIKESASEASSEEKRQRTEIKEQMDAVKAESKVFWEDAKTPNPGVVKVKEAKGFGGKVKAVVQGMKDSAAEAAEQEKDFRAGAIGMDLYRTVLTDHDTLLHNPYLKTRLFGSHIHSEA